MFAETKMLFYRFVTYYIGVKYQLSGIEILSIIFFYLELFWLKKVFGP